MELNPQEIHGPWVYGKVLDFHTVKSERLGEDLYGRPQFKNTRSDIGELLYKFKYRNDQTAFRELAREVCNHIKSMIKIVLDGVIAAPPSKPSNTVAAQISRSLAASLGVPFIEDGIIKVKQTEELKSIDNTERREEILAGAFQANPKVISGKSVLVVDDLYGSGATLRAITNVAYAQGLAKAVYVFAVTRTRVKQ